MSAPAVHVLALARCLVARLDDEQCDAFYVALDERAEQWELEHRPPTALTPAPAFLASDRRMREHLTDVTHMHHPHAPLRLALTWCGLAAVLLYIGWAPALAAFLVSTVMAYMLIAMTRPVRVREHGPTSNAAPIWWGGWKDKS